MVKLIYVKPIRDIKATKGRVAAVVLMVFFAVMMISMALSLSPHVKNTQKVYFSETKFADVEFYLQNGTEAIKDDLLALDNVRGVETRLVVEGRVILDDGEIVPARFIGVEVGRDLTVNVPAITDGFMITSPTQVMVLQNLISSDLKVGEGIDVSIQGTSEVETFTIQASVTSPEFMVPTGDPDSAFPLPGKFVAVFMSKNQLQSLTNLTINNICVTFEDPALSKETTSSVLEVLSPFGITKVTLQEDNSNYRLLQTSINKMDKMIPFMALMFGLIGFFLVYVTVSKLVMSQKKEIGVLFALGYTKRQVIASYVLYGIVVGLIGGLLGTAIGLLFGNGFATIIWQSISIIALIPAYTIESVIFGPLFGIFIVISSALIPILGVARMTPQEAIHHSDMSNVSGKPSLIESINPRKKKTSVWTLLGLRNVFRSRKRSLVTILSIGMIIGYAGSWLFMLQTMPLFLGDMDSQNWDFRVDLVQPQTEVTLANITGHSEVAYSEFFLQGYCEASHGSSSQNSILIGLDPQTKALGFTFSKGRIVQSGDEVMITSQTSDDLGVGLGDTIELSLPGLTARSYEIVGVFYDLKTNQIYTPLETAQTFFNLQGLYNGMFIQTTTESPTLLSELVYDTNYVGKLTTFDDMSTMNTFLLDLASQMMYGLFFMTLSLAIVFILSVMSINVVERMYEFTLLKSLGYGRGVIWRIISIEVFFIGLFAGILAIPFLSVFSDITGWLLEQMLFELPVEFSWVVAIGVFLISVLLITLSGYQPSRTVDKANLVNGLKERDLG